MNGGKKLWVGFGLSALFLALFLFTLDLEHLLNALADANYWYVIPGIALYLVAVGFRTLRWQWLLRHIKPIPVARLFPVVVVGYMANNLLPMRLGELVRSYYVGEREQVSRTSALVTIFIERLLDALTLLLFICTIAIFVSLDTVIEVLAAELSIPWPLLIAAGSLPFVIGFGGLMLIAFAPGSARSLARLLIRPLPARFEETAMHIVDMFLQGVESLRKPTDILVLFLMSLPIWIFEAGLFYMIGFSFGLHHLYDSQLEMIVAMVLVTAIANIGSSIPAAPGGVGLFEIIGTYTLVWLPLAAVDKEVAGAYIAVVHACLLIPMIGLGQVFLWAQHVSLRNLTRVGKQAVTEGEEAR